MSEYDDGALAFRLRQELRGDVEPEVENRWASFGNWQLVGHGGVSNEFCGRFFGVKACSRIELHNRIKYIKIQDKNGREVVGRVTNKVDRRIVFHFCNKPSCPVCFKHGWGLRSAGDIEHRLMEASNKWGLAEHIIVGIPSKFWGFDYEVLKKKCLEGCAVRGVVGGCVIFHGFRYANFFEAKLKGVPYGWYWSPHFHLLGFIFGGYKCRNCKIVKEKGKCGIENRDCDGFVNRNYRENEKDGLYFKVKGKRKTIFGTAYYQLGHSSVNVSRERFHVYTYFGVCSYRKLKVTVEKHKDLCRICGHERVWHDYFGSRRLVTDRNAPNFKFVDFDDVFEGGVRVYVERAPKEYG